MNKLIPLFLIALLLSACGGHSGKSPSESVKATGKAVVWSPVIIPVGSVIGGKKVAQKSAVASKAPPKWFSEEVSGEQLQALMRPTNFKLSGKWDYMGSRGKHHYFSQELVGRQIYRVLQTEHPKKFREYIRGIKNRLRDYEEENEVMNIMDIKADSLQRRKILNKRKSTRHLLIPQALFTKKTSLERDIELLGSEFERIEENSLRENILDDDLTISPRPCANPDPNISEDFFLSFAIFTNKKTQYGIFINY
jgi:hypothetical protein